MNAASVPAYPTGRLMERALDVLFPPQCVGCRRIGRWICPVCWLQVRWLTHQRCERCGIPSAFTICASCQGSRRADTVIASAQFDEVVRESVYALKYEERHAISSFMGSMMAAACSSIQADLVVPAALHSSRRRERGYDQTQLLARAMAQSLGMRTGKPLRRVRRTQQQALLGPEERRANVEGAFQASGDVVGKRIFLVDDVYTTGATMNAAAWALKEAGAVWVGGVVFACVR